MKKRIPMMFPLVILAIGMVFPSLVLADTYPSRPIQVIVPFPPGGVADLTARPVACRIGKTTKTAGGRGQQARSRRGGGNAVRGGEQTRRLYPAFGLGQHFGHPGSRRALRPPQDLQTGRFCPDRPSQRGPHDRRRQKGFAFQVHGRHRGRSQAPAGRAHIQFLRDLRGHPCSYGNVGPCRRDQDAAHSDAGGGPALTALLGGHVDILFSVPIIAYGQIKSGDLRPLAVTSDKRLPAYPNIPTLKELGYDVEYYIWCGLFAPQATPKETIKFCGRPCRRSWPLPNSKPRWRR